MKEINQKLRAMPVQTRLTLILIFTATSILGISGFINYITAKSEMSKELNNSADFWAEQLSEKLVLPLWNYDNEAGERVITSTMHEKQIYAVVVRKKNKDILLGRIRDGHWNPVEIGEDFPRTPYARTREISKDNKKIGTVEICLSPKFMYEKLRKSVSNTLLAIIVLNISLVFSIFISIKKKIIRPVSRIAGGISKGIEEIHRASEQVASASQSLAERNSEQVAASEEISASVEEISAMIRRNAENAGHADNFMKEVLKVVADANSTVKRLTDSMEEIIRTGKKISGLVRTIDDIAFQTNLLSLNAGIEAARAGEAGGGFAVVADEVRRLAIKAAQTAGDTSELVQEILEKIQAGGETTSETSESFRQVAAYADKIGKRIAEISQISHEQSLCIGRVSNAAKYTESITQNNAAGAEETACASEEMNRQAEEIKAFVKRLAGLVNSAENFTEDKKQPVNRFKKKALIIENR